MDLALLVERLRDPGCYPHPAADVVIVQTHISVVALAGAFAYKIKKPYDLGFLDFSTLERRRFFCEEEVRLNRRLAPRVYLGVVPVMMAGDGRVRVGGDGDLVEWAVRMQRLPDAARWTELLARGALSPSHVAALGAELAAFHRDAERSPRIAAFGRLPVVAGNALENFEQTARLVGVTSSPAVYDKVRALTEAALVERSTLIEGRAARGIPCDTHGDLRLEHVYDLETTTARDVPAIDRVIVDCIEYAERFRFADPVADMAFLYLDLVSEGRRDLADTFADAYFRASGDAEGRALLPFYTSYRAVVRAKVEGLRATELEVSESERRASLLRARGFWLRALGELAPPEERPCLVLVAGLPGTGKSTLAHLLAERAHFSVVRSDVVRKELAGASDEVSAGAAPFAGLYTREWTARTYEACAERAERLLFEGARVVVDANFRAHAERTRFFSLSRALNVPVALAACTAPADEAKRRLRARRSDASDADVLVYEQVASTWESLAPDEARALIDAGGVGPPALVLESVLLALRARGLVGGYAAEVGRS